MNAKTTSERVEKLRQERKPGRPTLPESERLVVVPVRMTPAQRDKFRAMPNGAARLRAWVDRVRG